MEFFALYFNLLIIFIELYWIFNYMDIEERKSQIKIFLTIGWLGVG